MKRTSKSRTLLITLAMAFAFGLNACGSADDGNDDQNPAGVSGTGGQGGTAGSASQAGAGGGTQATKPLSDQEKADLLALREEEKLARDVYLTLAKSSGIRVFSNIAKAEQTHTDRVKTLLDTYGLEDPVKDDTVGVFTNKDFKDLYDKLVAEGEKGKVEALTVGATIEDLDIHDIEEMEKRTDHEDILSTYKALACGSRNHMRAFYGQLQAEKVTYQAQYISDQELQAIVSSDHESCQ